MEMDALIVRAEVGPLQKPALTERGHITPVARTPAVSYRATKQI